MHGINLDQFDRFILQIMTYRFAIRSSRFKADDNLIKLMVLFKSAKLFPERIKAMGGIKLKRVNIFASGALK